MKNLILNSDPYVMAHVAKAKSNMDKAAQELRNCHTNMVEAYDHADENLKIMLRSSMDHLQRQLHEIEVSAQSLSIEDEA